MQEIAPNFAVLFKEFVQAAIQANDKKLSMCTKLTSTASDRKVEVVYGFTQGTVKTLACAKECSVTVALKGAMDGIPDGKYASDDYELVAEASRMISAYLDDAFRRNVEEQQANAENRPARCKKKTKAVQDNE